MSTFIAFLRGINVTGNNLIRMDALKSSLENAGLLSVNTYIQSGNLVFRYGTSNSMQLETLIHETIFLDFRLRVSVFVKTPGELEEAINENPFLPEFAQSIETLHLTFLERPPDQDLLRAILPLKNEQDKGQIIKDRIYLHCPNGYGRAKYSNTFFEKKLIMNATTRNWKTILTMMELAEHQSISR